MVGRLARHAGRALLAGILAGSYDANIEAVCAGHRRSEKPGHHEMGPGDRTKQTASFLVGSVGRPKASSPPYRRFVTECRKQLPDATLYVVAQRQPHAGRLLPPGDDFVDVVGLSVVRLPGIRSRLLRQAADLADALEQGYRLVEGYGKPIFVAELGYEGDRGYRARLGALCRQIPPRLPRTDIRGLFSTTAKSYPWPQNYGRPNWRVGGQFDRVGPVEPIGLTASSSPSDTEDFTSKLRR